MDHWLKHKTIQLLEKYKNISSGAKANQRLHGLDTRGRQIKEKIRKLDYRKIKMFAMWMIMIRRGKIFLKPVFPAKV
jgi:hypothetical protein